MYSRSVRTACMAWVLVLGMAAVCEGAVNFQWSIVGDAGNAADATSYGSVGYTYQISKHEVTNAQYTEFLNAKDPTGANTLQLYDATMSTLLYAGGIDYTAGAANGSKYTVKPGKGDKPVIQVRWYDSVRFANWIHNGQGTGSTETGAYTLLGGGAIPSNGTTVVRNAGATVVLPTKNEWYKAAYYKAGGVNAGYWTFATQSDTIPTSDQPPGAPVANSANYYNDDSNAGNGVNDGYAVSGSTVFDTNQYYYTDVGAYSGSLSAYGTFDQDGNIFEWVETIGPGVNRGIRGGSYQNDSSILMSSYDSGGTDPSNRYHALGFRVASVPEPTGIAIVLLGGMSLLSRGRGRLIKGVGRSKGVGEAKGS